MSLVIVNVFVMLLVDLSMRSCAGRYVSSYADWDVMARLPHGIEAIKHHLKHVDNVPLLVSLFTDSTPQTIQDMVGILRENGEVVMSIGSTYR